MNDEPAGLEQSGPLVFQLVFLHALLRGMYPKCDGCSMDLGEGCVVLVSPVRLTCHSCVSLLSEISFSETCLLDMVVDFASMLLSCG